MRPIGGSQGKRYQAMAANVVPAVVITPLDFHGSLTPEAGRE